jgi:hypothetical protein
LYPFGIYRGTTAQSGLFRTAQQKLIEITKSIREYYQKLLADWLMTLRRRIVQRSVIATVQSTFKVPAWQKAPDRG